MAYSNTQNLQSKAPLVYAADPLDKNIKFFPKVGPIMAKKLERLGIFTIKDLLYHFPFRYDDFSNTLPIGGIKVGEQVSIEGIIAKIGNTVTKNGKRLTIAQVADSSGTIEAVWFNQFYLNRVLKKNVRVSLAGKVEVFSKKPTLVSPEFEILTINRKFHTGRIVPVYPETAGVSSKWLRGRIADALRIYLPLIEDFLPLEIREENELIDLQTALNQIHFPTSAENSQKAQERLGFDELLLMQLVAALRRLEWQKKSISFRIPIDQKALKDFKSNLPFKLTGAQEKVLKDILNDINKNTPANRLIQGDVGSGKTVVAAAAAFIVNQAAINPDALTFGAENENITDSVKKVEKELMPIFNPNGPSKLKSIVMAPTEILARQHHLTLQKLLFPFGLEVVLQTGSIKGLKKVDSWDILVGTHALLTETVALDQVGLIVVDEQHRFGVEQRNLLRKKSETNIGSQTYVPHFVTMTATPIPRTLALTMYGDLDLSVIDEMPTGRQKVRTYVVSEQKRNASYGFIKEKLKLGQQAFIVCPFIEPSESLNTVKSAKAEFERLQVIFPEFKLGLLHGKLKGKEKDQVLTDFRDKKFDILVTTPVVEVGIDIPNATIMAIESAERFGLASLHQLRGRVGRGSQESFCLLYASSGESRSIQRLKTMETHNNGMELAQIDLEYRGSGDIVGTMQSGHMDLKIANLTDVITIEKTQSIARQILTSGYQNHPALAKLVQKVSSEGVSPD